MSVVNTPGWIGSSAANETGQRWMSAARSVLRLPGTGWMSEMAGRTKEIEINLYANHNFDWATLVNEINSRGVAGNAFKVTISGDLVGYTTGTPTLYFPASFASCAYIKIVNNATLYGRGGDGGTAGSREGKAGGVCITNEIGGKLQIENNGAICGGGGGGGGSAVGSNLVSGGSGGRPFGAAGISEGRDKQDGYAATLTSPGPQPPATRYGSIGGYGGEVGSPGGNGNKAGDQADGYPGGAAGWAINGNSPTWLKVGVIYGSRV